jgi:hypothetical protein
MSTLEVNTITPQSGTTLTLGGSGDTVSVASGVTNNLGITEADQWRITADFSASSGNNDIIANWERADSDSAGYFGTGMTESSGVFTFPSTGYYLLIAQATFYNSGSTIDYVNMNFTVSTDGGSSFDQAFRGHSAIPLSNTNFTATASFILDVTSTSNVKVRMSSNGASNYTVFGNTGRTQTGITFIRLGDT